MTQAKLKFASFEDYLIWSDDPENAMEGQFEWIDGELIEVPPESGPNDAIANRIFFYLVSAGIVPLDLIRPGKCEIQVPVLQLKDAANRYPDLVILREEHLALTQNRLTIKLDMPPPRVVAEVLSPGKQNRERDLFRKRNQYAARAIPEFWLIDPEPHTVTVLRYQDRAYRELGVSRGGERILYSEFPELLLTAEQVFGNGQ